MKRTALLRKTPMRQSTELAPKTCVYEKCGREFVPQRPMQNVCGPVCAGRWAKAQDQARKAEAKAADRSRRDAVMRLQDLMAEAQTVFNKWVRARDARQPCISCGAQPPEEGRLHAGRDAGHWRSVGAAGHLRFHEDNVHAQCVHCNQFGAGRAVEYRLGLIERIGLERVEALEQDNRLHKWTREELITIRDTYRAKLKALKAKS
jgi:hypothetical protein